MSHLPPERSLAPTVLANQNCAGEPSATS